MFESCRGCYGFLGLRRNRWQPVRQRFCETKIQLGEVSFADRRLSRSTLVWPESFCDEVPKMLLDFLFFLTASSVGAFVVWQAVRWINGRPNWRAIKWGIGAFVAFIVYVASFGPAYWWQHSCQSRVIPIFYSPLVEAAWHSPRFVIRWLGMYASCVAWREDERLGCSPLWPTGPRAVHWTQIQHY